MTIKIMVGVAGVGKDTYINKNKTNKDLVLSSDDIRLEMFNDLVEGNKHNNLIFEEMQKRLKENLNKYENIYYNATNLNRKKRKALYDMYKKKTDIETIVIAKPLKVILEQNDKREEYKKVPEYAIRRMYLSLEAPRIGVDTDKITVIGNFEEFLDEINENIEKSHDNPYHIEKIKEHIDKTIELAPTEKLKELAKFHDLGKSVARVKADINSPAKEFFLSKNGSFYQYMNHQNLSGLYYLVLKKDTINHNKYEQEMLELIIRHDDIINGISDKKKRTYNITDDMIKTLEEFREIDKNAATRSEFFEEYIELLKNKTN